MICAQVRRCLISDFRHDAAIAAATLRRIDERAAIGDWFDAATHTELRKAAPFLADEMYRGTRGITVYHRMARIVAYAEPPYDVTLYLDDDMFACPGVDPPLGAALLELAATADVRLAERWLSQGRADPGDPDSRAMAQELVDGRPPRLFRRFDLQGGAVLLKRSPAQRRFAQTLRRA